MTMQERLFRAINKAFLPEIVKVEAALCTGVDVYVAKERLFVTNGQVNWGERMTMLNDQTSVVGGRRDGRVGTVQEQWAKMRQR